MQYNISPEKLIKIRENKSKIQRNGTCFLTFLLLFTLLIICLIAPISRIAYTANCFAIIGMLLLIPLYHSSHKSELVLSSESVLFRQALIISSVEMSVSTILSVLEGKKEFIYLTYAMTTGVFLTMLIGFTIFFVFFLHFYRIPEKAKHLIFKAEILTSVICGLSIFLNIFTGWYFTIDENGYAVYPESYYLLYIFYGIWSILHIVLTLSSKIPPKTKFTLLSYCLPILLTIFTDSYLDIDASSAENTITGYCALGCLIFVFCNILIERSEEAISWKEKQRELQSSMMLSQIQPHFMYNTLTTIYFLCDEDPDTAQEAIDKFSRYLRTNMKTMAATGTIPFSEELEHTKTYLWIEKLRFEDRLNVEYDIQCSDFDIPPLTLQPIVENAVKHGIGVIEDGGTIKISTRRDNDKVILTISDNGAGFDVEHAFPEGEDHVGMNNVKTRLNKYNCELKITSTIGKGTNAEIIIK